MARVCAVRREMQATPCGLSVDLAGLDAHRLSGVTSAPRSRLKMSEQRSRKPAPSPARGRLEPSSLRASSPARSTERPHGVACISRRTRAKRGAMHILPLSVLLAAATAPARPPPTSRACSPRRAFPPCSRAGSRSFRPICARAPASTEHPRGESCRRFEDGSTLLISTRFASTAQLQPGGDAARNADPDHVRRGAGHAGEVPAGRHQTVWYLQDKVGGEFFQVYRLDRRSGRSELLTDGRAVMAR